MRAALLALTLAVLVVVGVGAMSDAMKFHTDTGRPGSRTVITFDAQARDGSADPDPALKLWQECRSHVNHVRLTAGPVEHDGLWSVTVEPALGTHTERRLLGCLRDLTADGISGHLVGAERTGG
ncbi:hypothetical protein [Nocardia sp. IFM 10818]